MRHAGIDRPLNGAVHDGNIRRAFDMLAEHFLIIDIDDDVAVGHDDVFLARAAQVAEVGAQRVEHALVNAGIIPREERRQNKQAVVLAVQVPFLAAAEMIHEGMIIPLRNHADVARAGIDQAGHLKVDHAIASHDGQRRHGAGERQFAQKLIVFAGIDKTHQILHSNTPPVTPCFRIVRPERRPYRPEAPRPARQRRCRLPPRQ